jgi:radical SAM protein with 4Fe4S-binding SPASM domain
MKSFWKFISLVNKIVNFLESTLRRKFLISNPTLLHIETSTHCNLNCNFCGRQSYWKYFKENPKHISKNYIKKLRPFLKTAYHVALHGWGEPLMNPEIAWIINECEKYGCKIMFHTNGLLINDEIIDTLIKYKVESITISIDAATKNTYELLRGGSFNILINNLIRLNTRKEHLKSKYPLVEFKYILMKSNINDLDHLIDLAKICGIYKIIFQHLIEWTNKKELKNQSVFDIEDIDDLIKSKVIEKAGKIKINYPGIKRLSERSWRCGFSPFVVMVDGYIGPCGPQQLIYGHINQGSLRKIWNNQEYLSSRKEYFHGKLPAPCNKCAIRYNDSNFYKQPNLDYIKQTLKKHYEL